MCGIAGLIFDQLDPRGGDWLTSMVQCLYHRGPDDGGAVVFGLGGKPVIERRLGPPGESITWNYLAIQMGLAARRLAVLDPGETGRQPMGGGEGSPWLVFNGAIYNFRRLRDDLRAAGMTFRGSGDTEVVLAAFRHWGPACFEKLEGMWALAIYEPAARRVVLSRDRFGIKPLYLTRFEKGVAFASEIKSLLTLPGVRREAEASLLCDFLVRGLVDHTDRTLFEGIWSVPPGSCITFDVRDPDAPLATGIDVFDGLSTESVHDGADPQAADSVRKLIRRAVASHLVSDVPVGSCLSGGIDSSFVVCAARAAVMGDALKLSTHWSQSAFTACLPGDPLDESRYAETVVGTCGDLNWRRVEPTAEGLVRDMTALMWHQEQPFGSPSIYMQWEVMRAARARGVTVLLDGQGGDELFCGYEGHLPPYLAHLLGRLRLALFLREFRAAVREGHGARSALAAHVAVNLAPRVVRDAARKRLDRVRFGWIVGELFDAPPTPGIVEGLGMKASQRSAGRPSSRLDEQLWRLIRSESLPSLLRFEDRSSMAFSVEARVPLLDRRLVELAMSLPVSKKIKDGRLKAVLRDAAVGIVPDEIIARRDKIGFSAPTAAWMRGALGDWWREALGSMSFLERGCFRAKGVERLIRRFDSGDDRAAPHLWRLAITEQWARQSLDHRCSKSEES